MSSICCISRSEVSSLPILNDFIEVKGRKLNMSDVATLVETFEKALNEVDSKDICGVLINPRGNFIFECAVDGEFDFYKFLNDSYSGGVTVNCVNAKWLFPRGLSRGIFTGNTEVVTESMDVTEEEATGFMNEEDLKDFTGIIKASIVHKRSGITFSVVEGRRFVVGRSAKKANYVVQGNTNVSREHVELYFKDGVLMVHDMGSANGTYINGRRVVGSVDESLKKDDVLVLADEEFIII